MTIDVIHLRKLLKFLQLNPAQTRSALRREAYEDRRREEFPDEGGGDFHAPFWSDAKAYVTQGSDLNDAVDYRIQRNDRRARLYPMMRDRFLEWWEEFERGTNETLVPQEERVHARHRFEDLGITVKVDNLLALGLGEDRHQLIYPYFSEAPPISPRWARVGLWVMAETLEAYSVDDMLIVDIHRARAFSTRTTPLQGDEGEMLAARMSELRDIWNEILAETL